MRLAVEDINDELIRPVAAKEPELLSMADEYLDDLARSLDVEKSIESIPIPLPYKVKRLAVAYVCREICVRKAGGSLGTQYSGQDKADRWTSKLPFWTAELRALEGQMTAELLFGERKSGWGCITLERG